MDAAAAPGFVGEMINVLRTGGPYAIAVIAGAFAWKKDRDKDKLAEALFAQVMQLSTAQTAAMVKTESTLSALKDVIQALETRV